VNYYLKFAIGNVELAVPIDEVKEIARPKKVQKDEKNQRGIFGSFVFRKRKIILYDLPQFLRIEPKDTFEVIISEMNQKRIGFKVDKVHGVIAVEILAPIPDLAKPKNYLRGVIVEDENLVQVLSLTRLLSGTRFASLAKYL
jgi:chemotaxis signal transduction protein